MVRASSVGLILMLSMGCSEVTQSPGASPTLDISAGMTTVLTHSGLDWINGTINNRLQETFEDGVFIQFPEMYLGDSPSNPAIEKREVVLEGCTVEAPKKDRDMEIPVIMDLGSLTWSLTSEGEEGLCETTYTMEEISLEFSLIANKSRSGDFTFGISEEQKLVFDEILNNEECPSVTEAELQDWAGVVKGLMSSELQALIAPIVIEELGLNIQANGTLNTVGANNTLTSMNFALTPGNSESAISSRGEWLNFDLDIAVESGRHECAPVGEVPTESEVIPLDSSDMWGDPPSAPYEYVVLLSRQAARLVLRHWVRSGRFCQRHIPISLEQAERLLPHLPNSPPEGAAALSMNLQVFSLPEVQFSGEDNGPVVRIFFTHARVDLNQVVDGAHIRLVTLDAPISLAVGLRFTPDLAFSGLLRGVNVLNDPLEGEEDSALSVLRSPLWGELDGNHDLAVTMAEVMGEELLDTVTPIALPQPITGQMTPLSSFLVTEDHLAFPFFVGATLTGSD